jgi:WD40 repeat protein
VDLKHFTKYPTPIDREKKKGQLLNDIKLSMKNSVPSKLLKLLKLSVHKDATQPIAQPLTSKSIVEKVHTIKFGKKSYPTCSIFSGDSNLIIGTNDGFVEVWNTGTGKRADLTYQNHEDFMMHSDAVTCLDVCGNYLASGDKSGQLKIWDWSKGTCVRKFVAFTNAISAVCFSPDGGKIVSAATSMKLFGLNGGSVLKEFTGHESFVNDLKFVSDNVFVSASSDRTLRFWNLNNNEAIHTMTFENSLISIRCFTESIFVGEVSSFGYLIDLKTKKAILKYEGDVDFVFSTCDDKRMVGVTEAGTLNIFELQNGVIEGIVNTEHKKPVSQIQFGENVMSTLSMDGTCQIWKF